VPDARILAAELELAHATHLANAPERELAMQNHIVALQRKLQTAEDENADWLSELEKATEEAEYYKQENIALRLRLDESSRLVCHYTNFGAYIPEEFKMFQDYFNQTPDRGWTMIPRESYLKLEGNLLTFPDFRFRSDSGTEIDVELFHQWHKTPLKERLDYLEQHPETPLILGVDRVCLKNDEELKERFQARPGNFLFSSFPGVENVIKALDKKERSGGDGTFKL